MTNVGSLSLADPWRLCIGVEMSHNEKKAAVYLFGGLLLVASVFLACWVAYLDEPAVLFRSLFRPL